MHFVIHPYFYSQFFFYLYRLVLYYTVILSAARDSVRKAAFYSHRFQVLSMIASRLLFQVLSMIAFRYCLYASLTSSGQLIRIPFPIPASHPKNCGLTVTVTPA